MALAERFLPDRISPQHKVPQRDGDVVLGDDFVVPDTLDGADRRGRRRKSSFFRRSPLTRKIITFNLIALNIRVAGVLFLNSTRDSYAVQRINAMVSEAELIADVLEAQLPRDRRGSLQPGGGIDVPATLAGLDLRQGIEVFVFDPQQTRIGNSRGNGISRSGDTPADGGGPPTVILDFLGLIWSGLSQVFGGMAPDIDTLTREDKARTMIPAALTGATQLKSFPGPDGTTVHAVASPVMQGSNPVGVVAVFSATGEIDRAVRMERERVLQMFLIATLVSVGLSLVLASTIANPISDLAEAAELGGRDGTGSAGRLRIRIPDLTARPDEIGRLSGALRGMVSALYDRIDSNEQFAADVAHEIKNPLASLRSAVGTLRRIKREDQRDKLLDVIEHDVRRLDRLVSDISNASRLDSELVKEEQEQFDLLKMLGNLGDHLGGQAREQGIDFITDLPRDPIMINGLEARLAQVFVNLITNAMSFCEDGDAIRVWARRRENRVLVVVEDTGPGIPEQALTKIFKRFYSERPPGQYGNNSGLGLSISKQIVEAHGGVIWAENIRPTDADITSDPLGARFVVGLPV